MHGLVQKFKLNLRLLAFRDHAESYAQVVSGKADAFATDDVLLYGLIAQNKAQGRYFVVGEFLSYDPYGIMYRKGDAQLARLVIETFRALAGDGEMERQYKRWFLSRLPSGIQHRPADEPAARVDLPDHGGQAGGVTGAEQRVTQTRGAIWICSRHFPASRCWRLRAWSPRLSPRINSLMHGADVIHIENPEDGDSARTSGNLATPFHEAEMALQLPRLQREQALDHARHQYAGGPGGVPQDGAERRRRHREPAGAARWRATASATRT